MDDHETDPRKQRRLFSDPMEVHFARLRPERTTAKRAWSWRVVHWAAVPVMEIGGHRASGERRAQGVSCLTRYLVREAQELACIALAPRNPLKRSAAFQNRILWYPRNARNFHGSGISIMHLYQSQMTQVQTRIVLGNLLRLLIDSPPETPRSLSYGKTM